MTEPRTTAPAGAERRVKDLMLPLSEYATVPADRNLRDAVVALYRSRKHLTKNRHHHRAVLAIDDRGRVVGKLTYWAILASLEPPLIGTFDAQSLQQSSLSPELVAAIQDRVASLQGGLDRMCQAAGLMSVSDAMVPVDEHIDEAAPLTEAIDRLVDHHAQSMLVTSGDAVVGILRLSDVFEEVGDLIRRSAGSES